MNIGSLVVSLGIDPSGLYVGEAAMAAFGGTANKTINSVNNSIKQLGMSFRSFGWLASTVLTAPLIMFGKSVLKAFSDYEYSMAKIQALTNATGSDVKAWFGEVIALGPKVGKAPQELAESLYFISSSGIAASEAMDVLKVSAKAAEVGLGETKTVADIVTSALNAYRGTGLSAAYVGDVMVAAVREGKAEASGFATAMGSVIPIAAQLGMRFEEVAGSMAAITLTGASAANAATYLRNILMKFIHPAAQSEEQLKKMGSSSKELRQILAGPTGLMGALGRVKEMTDKWGVEAMGRVFPNIRAMLAYLSLMGRNLEMNKGVMERVKNATGDLSDAFNIVAKTTKFQLDSAISSLKGNMILLGESIKTSVLPWVQKIVTWFDETVKKFNSLTEAQKQARIGFAAFLIAIGPAALIISMFLNGITMLVKGILALVDAYKVLRLLMINNPWLLVLVGIGLATTALIKYHNKTVEAAKANTIYAKSVVTVNGELKKLKGLTEIDYSTMSGQELFAAQKKISEDHARTRDHLVKAYEMAGISEDRLKILMRAAAGIPDRYDPSISVENAKKELGRVGKWHDSIDILQIDLLEMQTAYEMVGKAINNWADNFGKGSTGVIAGLDDQGDAMEDAADKANKYKKVLDELNEKYQKQLLGINVKNPVNFEAGFYEKTFMKLQKGRLPSDDIMDNLAKDLDFIATKESALNQLTNKRRDLYNDITGRVNAYSKALDELLTKERTPDVAANIDKTTMALVGMQDEFDSLENTNKIIDMLHGAFMTLFDSILEGGRRMSDVLVDIVKTMISQIMSELSRMLITKIIMAIASHGTSAAMPVPPDFATGGVVPNGYPNDTYPALLSSGETVLPKRLNSNAFNQPNFEGQVVFEIGQDKLVGILQRATKKNNIY